MPTFDGSRGKQSKLGQPTNGTITLAISKRAIALCVYSLKINFWK
ncbi:MAG: hypothetical protein WBB28_20555 [Crinalium sp.]